jgi:hypothetical protein
MRVSRTVLRGALGATPEVYSPCDANRDPRDGIFSAVVDDEGRPLGACVQKQASNQAVLLWSKRSWW